MRYLLLRSGEWGAEKNVLTLFWLVDMLLLDWLDTRLEIPSTFLSASATNVANRAALEFSLSTGKWQNKDH